MLSDESNKPLWSFEGHLNSVSRVQRPDNRLVLAKGVDIFDPLTECLYKGYIGYKNHKESYVVGSQQGSTEYFVHTTKTPDYLHVHNIIIPMNFEMNMTKHKVRGQPLIIQGQDFFEIGVFLTGITISQDPATLNSVCTLVLYKMNNLEYVRMLDDYKKNFQGLDK